MANVQQDLVQRTLFAQDSVKQLHQSDFVDLESDTKINIIYKECMLVLFYVDNLESKNLTSIWAAAAKNTVGPVFAACNLMVEKRVAEAFTSLNMQNGVLHWAALKTLPYILVYQNGWPIAFYNGERSVQSIIDYSLTLACKAEYHEPFNLFAGMTISNTENILMRGDTQYGIQANPFRKDSLGYRADEDIRGYDKDDEVKAFQSTEDKAISRHNLANERVDRVGLPPSTIPVTAVPTTQEQRDAEARTAGQQAGEQADAATEQRVEGGVRVAPPGIPSGETFTPTQQQGEAS